jgi:hypothetical protein
MSSPPRRNQLAAVNKVINTIARALAATGSIVALARAVNVAPSHISRIRKGLVGVGPEVSLRLSYILGRVPLRGLRDDGHGELANLLEAFFNLHDNERAIRQRALDADIAALSARDYVRIRGLMRSLANAARREGNAPPSSLSDQHSSSSAALASQGTAQDVGTVPPRFDTRSRGRRADKRNTVRE